MKIMVINGPNLNLLGLREPQIYGKKDYIELIKTLEEHASKLDIEIDIKQSSYEGTIIRFLHDTHSKKYDGVIINPAAYTHYSIAIRDAIAAINIPTIEVHLSDITKREPFRQVDVVKDVCIATFMGKGFDSYIEAIDFLKEYINNK